MATIESVNGPIEPDELGLTLIHEHFRSRRGAAPPSSRTSTTRRPSRRPRPRTARARRGPRREDRRRADRDDARPRRRVQLSGWRDETGLQIVACTGIYTYDHLPHLLLNRDEDLMADIFVHDIEEGIQGTVDQARRSSSARRTSRA